MVLRLGVLDAGKRGTLLICHTGTPKAEVCGNTINSLFPPIEQHSKKPDITREKIIALMGDIPRIELFARQETAGWDTWGNETKNSIEL